MKNARHKILLIEENKLDQTAFERFLEDESLLYDCTIAGSVSQAHSAISAEWFDIIILDYRSGNGAVLDILDSAQNTPFIFITEAADEQIAVEAVKTATCDYLIKDLKRNYLKAIPPTIENIIRHKRTEEKIKLISRQFGYQY